MVRTRSCRSSCGLSDDLQSLREYLSREAASLFEMPSGTPRRNHAPQRNSLDSLAPVLVIGEDVGAWAAQGAHEALAGSSQNEGPRSERSGAGQEQVKCYTRRKCLPLCVAAALPQENREENFEENSESAPLSKSPKLRGQRSSRKRREIPPPLAVILLETVSEDDGTDGSAPEPDAPVGRSRRQRKPKIFKDYQRSDTNWYDWQMSYPDEPCPPEYGHESEPGCNMKLGDVEAISVREGGSSDISDNVERPMSLKSQIDTQKTRKARRILVEDSRFPLVPRNVQARTEAPVPPVQHDESAICPQTPEKLQESNGECEGDGNPTQSESAPDKDSSWTPSEDASTRSADSHLPPLVTEGTRTSMRLVVELSGDTSNGCRLVPEEFTVEAKVRLRKKHPRPKVKRPVKVKVAKPTKVPKIPKTSKRKSISTRGAFEHNNAKSRTKGAAVPEHPLHATATAEFVEPAPGRESQASKRQRQNESSPSSETAEVITAEVPHISAEAIDNSLTMATGRNTLAGGEICIRLPILESSCGISIQQEYEDRRGECCVPTIENGPAFDQRAECDPRLEDPGGSELTMEKVPESDRQLQSCPVIRCIPNFGGVPVPGGSWMEEEPPSTPRGNALMVLPDSEPFLSSPSFSQPSFGDMDSSTDSDGEQTVTTPTRRKRSSLSQRTRRSLLSAVEAAENSLVPLSVSAPIPQSDIPFFSMTETQKEQHARALRKDPRFSKDPMGLVKELISGTPERLLSELTATTRKLVFDMMDKDVGAVDPANQLVYNRRSPARFPLPIDSRESSAQEQLQLVVFGQKSSEMVVYPEMIPKVKYKPKVFLDPMTIKTFDRLMLQGGEVNDADHADEDWIEARKLWSDRAHRFNCIMRQVQGDRTFSKWGGSLLDSVVGAFLTQNVSDFLSSNAFMELRAHFPVREDSRSGLGASSEEQSSLTEEIIPSGCPVGTSNTDLSTPQMAEEDQSDSIGGSKEKLGDSVLDNHQESASLMPDAVIQDNLLVTEVSITHTHMDTTFLEDSQDAMNIFVDLPSDEAQRYPDQSDPYGFSDEDRSAETLESSIVNNDLVIALEAVQIGSTPVAQGSCSPTEIASPGAGVPDEHVTENVDNETPQVTETNSEVSPEVANRVQHGGNSLKEHHPGTQADTEDRGEKGNQSDMAGSLAQIGKASSRFASILEAKFNRSMKDDSLTPDESEKMLAAALKKILGKKSTGRESEAARGPVVPLEMVKRKKPRNKRYVDMNRFKTKLNFLTGGERAYYELNVSYKLNSEQRVTWEALRAEVLLNKECERDPFTADSVDWEAVRRADVAEVANVIKERGMNNILGGRIKSLLDRLHRDQDGRLDLEWIRELSPVHAQNFLTSVRGLGLKSVECIRLLTLHHPSFPVDVNVGRIVVRLGWVPLEPLPEETQLHLLEMYPVQEQIQKYIWPRLCTLDQRTLYEFHYQLITFGKVFCTKSKPNCKACPLRSQCKHFESAYCRPLLQGPGEASDNSMHQIQPLTSRPSMQPPLERSQSLLMLGDQARASQGACIPIIEEPNSPEYVLDIEDMPFAENSASIETDYMELSPFRSDLNLDLEPSPCLSDLASECGKELMCVDLNKTPTQTESEEPRILTTTKDVVQEIEGSIEDIVEEATPQLALDGKVTHVPSQELVLLPPQAASFPAPPLKNVQRLRTIHYVYELPDHHPLLAKMDKRDSEDPCFYLLAIWNSDEVPEAMPKISDDDASNPFACSQPGDEAVRGTLLVPCRTAMKGSFPLNGTYFQVNEVFADHASSIVPIDVPRTLLWDLRRRFVYFGTSVTSIFKGMSQEEIQCCFKKGYVCVRAFDQNTRQPRLLAARLHQSGAKIVAGRALAQKGRRASKFKDA